MRVSAQREAKARPKADRKKALIKVGYGCNDHCSFCHTLDVRHIDAEALEVRQKIYRAKELGHSMVVLSGGEPTIRPELFKWAELVASLDMDFGLVTNGRLLSYANATDRLLKSRLRYVYLSLHGGTPKVHNLMVRSHAFDETYGALKNLSGKGIDLHVNCVITRGNVEHLLPIVDALAPYPDAKLKFSMVEPKGGGDKLFSQLMPSVSTVAERVFAALKYADERGVHAQHGAIPLCLLPGFETHFDDLKTHGFFAMVEVGEKDFFPVDDLNKVHPKACDGCTLRGPCPGLYRGYDEAFGDIELRPSKDKPRSNSFNFALSEVWPTSVPCELRDGKLGITPWDRGRDLFVKRGERLALFRSETRDFSDLEIAEIKHDKGQVYYDISNKDAPDNFARDLVQLRRSQTCSGCSHEKNCTGVFEPLFEPLFERDDKKVRKLLSSLTGDVLDLGCGESPYAGALTAAMNRSELRYIGVDPSGNAVEKVAKQLGIPTGQVSERGGVFVGTGETLGQVLEAAQVYNFDSILMLRSYNHLREPAKVLAAAQTLLKDDGQLVVVDNEAFGLARSKAQTARGENSNAELEHFQNASAAKAESEIKRAGFAIIERIDVSPETSNQWFIRAQKSPY